MKYFCEISYVGTDFFGFQAQPDKRTVQGELTRCFKEAFSCPCKITGCSRTDRGVHARMFCITVEPEQPVTVPPDKLGKAMSSVLPDDISILSAKFVEDNFHPRYNAKGKEYVYLLDNGTVKDPFLVNRAFHLPRHISDTEIDRMNLAAKQLEGTHDFTSFMAKGSKIEDCVRTVSHFSVKRISDTQILFKVSADGFLYNMVRILVGTLLEIGRGKKNPEDVPAILEAKHRKAAGFTAPPSGLYLNRVFY